MNAEAVSIIARAAIVGSTVSIGMLLATAYLRRAAPTLRHLLLLLSLGSFIAAPVLSLVLPRIAIASPIPTPIMASFDAGDSSTADSVLKANAESPRPSDPATGEARGPIARPTGAVDWRSLVLVAWILGAIVLSLRMGIAFIGLRQIVRRSIPLGPAQEGRARSLAALTCPDNRPRFAASTSCSVPMTLGTIHPVVMLPPRIAVAADASFDAIVMHELVHVRRHDVLTSRAAYFICSLFWFVPFAWIDLSRLRLEQEKACDEEASAACLSRYRYAELLVEVRASAARLSLAAALSAPVTGFRALEERVRTILQQPRAVPRAPRVLRSLLAVGALCIMVPLSMLRCSPSPAPAAPNASVDTTAAISEFEVRLQLRWKSGATTLAPDASTVMNDFPKLWPIESPPGRPLGEIVKPFAAPTAQSSGRAGIDIAWATGSPIVASGNGTVIAVGSNADDGNYVTISHMSGFQSTYSHLREPSPLGTGAVVSMGQRIGTLGNAGKSSGPHLQFSLTLNGAAVDPKQILGGTIEATALNYRSATVPTTMTVTTNSTVTDSGISFTQSSVTTSLETQASPLRWPLGPYPQKQVGGVITVKFGPAINPFTKKGYFHKGVDIAWATGTPVVAATGGTVTDAGSDETNGNFVRIVSVDKIETYYSHLAAVSVTKGDYMTAGQRIGTVGMTGQTTGPHLHFEASFDGALFDPMGPPAPDGTPTEVKR